MTHLTATLVLDLLFKERTSDDEWDIGSLQTHGTKV